MSAAIQPHWRPDETTVSWVEQSVRVPKYWTMLEELPPSTAHVDAYEAEVAFIGRYRDLERHGDLFLRGHQEEGGTIIISFLLGATVLRRAHIGGGHQDPDAGPYIPGPHIHFPTTAFPIISGRRARSRVHPWSVPDMISLREAVFQFAAYLNILGVPAERQRLIGGPP